MYGLMGLMFLGVAVKLSGGRSIRSFRGLGGAKEDIEELALAADAPSACEVQPGMVYQIWEDGEVTLQKCGDLLWQRTLHMVKSPIPGAASLGLKFPHKFSGGHSFAWLTNERDGDELRALIQRAVVRSEVAIPKEVPIDRVAQIRALLERDRARWQEVGPLRPPSSPRRKFNRMNGLAGDIVEMLPPQAARIRDVAIAAGREVEVGRKKWASGIRGWVIRVTDTKSLRWRAYYFMPSDEIQGSSWFGPQIGDANGQITGDLAPIEYDQILRQVGLPSHLAPRPPEPERPSAAVIPFRPRKRD